MSKTQLHFSFARSACFTPLPLGELVGGLVGTRRAAWPVWADSTRKEVRFQPLPKRLAVKLYHEARRFERRTRAKGKQDGALGRNGLAVLHAMLFDILNYATGALTPAQKTIARFANISPRSVARGLVKLKAAGVVNWLRRCVEDCVNGRFQLRQESNAYAILPVSQWRGYTPTPEPQAPEAGTWGDHPPLPPLIDQACEEKGRGLAAMLRGLADDPRDELATLLAAIGQGIAAKG